MSAPPLTLAEHPVRGWRVNPETGDVFGVGGRWAGQVLGRIGTHGYLLSTYQRQTYLLHRVVWEACVGPIPPGLVINHKNGIKTDNRLANLEVVTRSENNQHAYRIGLRIGGVWGEKNSNYRVTPAMHAAIRSRLASGERGSVIAAAYGLSGATVSKIKRGVR